MSYKTDLQSNNIDLQEILNTINSLPEAGSSTTETWILTLEDGSTVTKEMVVGE